MPLLYSESGPNNSLDICQLYQLYKGSVLYRQDMFVVQCGYWTFVLRHKLLSGHAAIVRQTDPRDT